MFTNEEKYKALVREVALRARVYPGFVARGKMKQAVADRELAIMRAIAQDYKSVDEQN